MSQTAFLPRHKNSSEYLYAQFAAEIDRVRGLAHTQVKECPGASTRTRPYSSPRNRFTTPRIAFSLRRYHRHWPFLLASTSPAFVKMLM